MTRRFLAADIETAAADGGPPTRRDTHITRIGFAEADAAGRLGRCASLRWSPAVARFSAQLLEPSAGTCVVFFNRPYDIPILARHDVPVVADCELDPMFAAQLDQPDLPKALGRSAWRSLGPMPAWKHLSGEGGDEALYNAWDAATTAVQAARLWPVMEAQGVLPHLLRSIQPGSLVLQAMTDRGMRADPAVLAGWREELDAQSASDWELWRRETAALLGSAEPASISSSALSLKRLLFERLKLPVLARTETGQPATTAEVLTRTARHRDVGERERGLIALLLRLRCNAKQESTYARGRGIEEDGCFHPSYLPQSRDFAESGSGEGGGEGKRKWFAASGRRTSGGSQNLTREAKRIYCANEPGWVLVEADWSQIEDRLVAWMSDNTPAIEAYESGEDLHCVRAATWGCSRPEAKTRRYAMSYGQAPRTFAVEHGLRIREAEEMWEAYFAANPREAEWRRQVQAQAASGDQTLTNYAGRLRRFHGHMGRRRDREAAGREAINFLPQSTVADMGWELLDPLERDLQALGACLYTEEHDKFVAQGPEEKAAEMVACLRDHMGRDWGPRLGFGRPFRVPVDAKIGRNWGEMQDADEWSG